MFALAILPSFSFVAAAEPGKLEPVRSRPMSASTMMDVLGGRSKVEIVAEKVRELERSRRNLRVLSAEVLRAQANVIDSVDLAGSTSAARAGGGSTALELAWQHPMSVLRGDSRALHMEFDKLREIRADLKHLGQPVSPQASPGVGQARKLKEALKVMARLQRVERAIPGYLDNLIRNDVQAHLAITEAISARADATSRMKGIARSLSRSLGKKKAPAAALAVGLAVAASATGESHAPLLAVHEGGFRLLPTAKFQTEVPAAREAGGSGPSATGGAGL